MSYLPIGVRGGAFNITAVRGLPLRRAIAVRWRTFEGGVLLPDLSGLGSTFRIYDEGRETALVTETVAVGAPGVTYEDRTQVLRLSVPAAKMDIAVPEQVPERKIPVRFLPYTFCLEDSAGRKGELLSGYIHLFGRVAA